MPTPAPCWPVPPPTMFCSTAMLSTGKSSTVKAIANEYAADGLRLVEVKKNQLYQIPDLMDQLAANPSSSSSSSMT